MEHYLVDSERIKVTTLPVHTRPQHLHTICQQCKTVCCFQARPPLTQQRQMIIQQYIARRTFSVNSLFIHTSYTFPRETSDGWCIFFDAATRRCRIHPVKPETCIAGPITFDVNPATKTIGWYLKQPAICSFAGVLAQHPQHLHHHLVHAKTAIHRLIRQLPTTELVSVLQIDEPDTYQIAETPLDIAQGCHVDLCRLCHHEPLIGGE